MVIHTSIEAMEDHALERVPGTKREGWLQIAWNTVGLATTLVILFFGALVCFVAGVKIALAAGFVSFLIGSSIGWAIARIAYQTGFSNTLITRRYGLGTRGSALASLIFGCLIVGFLAVENGLLYRGFLFFFKTDDSWLMRLVIYGGLTVSWILLTAFGFKLVTRFSSIMLIGFFTVLAWIFLVVLQQSGGTLTEVLWFESQVQPAILSSLGVDSDWDKFVFSLNILIGPACALALNTADFGRYGKSTVDVGIAASIAIFSQSIVIMLIGGVLIKSAAAFMVHYYITVAGMDPAAAQAQVLQSPDSIAATFMVLSGALGFILMLLAQAKAQVLNTYSSSLCIANLADALFRWRPGRVVFVVLANAIALAMLYGHILEMVETWIKLMGVLLSALASVIIMDYYFVGPRLASDNQHTTREDLGHSVFQEPVNWSGVIAIIAAAAIAHFMLRNYFKLEVLSSIASVVCIYPLLRLRLFRRRGV